MTNNEFESYLITTRAKLVAEFQNSEDIENFDVYTKLALDYQDTIFKSLFLEFENVQKHLVKMRADLLKDNRERFTELHKKLNE